MQRPTHSQVLRGKLDLFGRPLDAVLDRFWASPDVDRLFPRYLVQVHQMIRASVPLMETARRCAAARADDPVCAALVGYLDEHIEEERDHDLWVLEDLEVLGVPRSEALSRIPAPCVAALVGAQYYWIQHHHPVALLGYIASLEDRPASAAFLADLQARTGFPEAAFRTLRKHGQLDPGHREALDRFFDHLPLLRPHLTLIGLSLAHTASCLTECIENLL
ncbi:MAG TPA: iron-containing redox enzyme family protein [Polyangia bacterium]|jgi:hypothetical protein|nr:iron-containing redox enzyme family protein [Polyangia bacterium]